MAATDRTRTDARPARTHPAIERWKREHGYGSRSYGGHGTLTPDGIDRVDAAALARDLSAAVGGEVRFGAGDRAIYSHDSSNYRQPPIGVVVPRDSNDVVAATEVCRRHGAPIVSRGCATGLAGQTCNVAVVIDHSQHLRSILDVDPEGGRARIQPGVIRDQLAHRVEGPYGLTFGPDTSTHAYATLGGMIGNNSCGTHSVLAGRTADNVHELEVVTYDGVRMTVGRTSDAELEAIVAAGGRRGEIYAAMRDLRDRYADAIRERYPDIPRRVSGYNLDELLPERGFDVARALVGSEGTLRHRARGDGPAGPEPAGADAGRLRLPRRLLAPPTTCPRSSSTGRSGSRGSTRCSSATCGPSAPTSRTSACCRTARAGCSSSSAARRPRNRTGAPTNAWSGSPSSTALPR